MAKHILRLTGTGGQGILVIGEILIGAKRESGGHGIKASSYSGYVRGGPTITDIVLDDVEIVEPIDVDKQIDFMVSIAQLSYDQYKSGVKPGGKIVVDPDFVTVSHEDREIWKIYEIKINKIAREEVNDISTQPMVTLAILNNFLNIIDRDDLEEAMFAMLADNTHNNNERAFNLGYQHSDIVRNC